MEEEEKEQEDLVTSTVRPEEIPPIPENRFLMRGGPQTTQTSNKEEEKDQRNKDDRPRQKLVFFKQLVMKYCLHELICMSLLSSFAAPVRHIILCQHIRNGLW